MIFYICSVLWRVIVLQHDLPLELSRISSFLLKAPALSGEMVDSAVAYDITLQYLGWQYVTLWKMVAIIIASVVILCCLQGIWSNGSQLPYYIFGWWRFHHLRVFLCLNASKRMHKWELFDLLRETIQIIKEERKAKVCSVSFLCDLTNVQTHLSKSQISPQMSSGVRCQRSPSRCSSLRHLIVLWSCSRDD